MLNTVNDSVKDENNLVSLVDASKWASELLNKNVTTSNISYLIQYALIRKFEFNGSMRVSISDLKAYYETCKKNHLEQWNKKDSSLNWTLAFDNYKESETTKHVHRLHPYKGKFIPQLVEYFIDNHTDDFKKNVYFQPGDIILDPFCGSGTTLVQANEMGINAVGIDVSIFNTIISNCKISQINISELTKYVAVITNALKKHYQETEIFDFENNLLSQLNIFNQKNFPNYQYKTSVRNKTIDETKYSSQKLKEFLPEYYNLINKYNIDVACDNSSFINKWFIPNVRNELCIARDIINNINDSTIKNALIVILSRTMRSCRATTHSDLATLLKPVTAPYYCTKHYKICKPLFSIIKWWETYSKDTIKRFIEFDKLKTNSWQVCLTGDSRNIEIYDKIAMINMDCSKDLRQKKFAGIFSSPPYVGLIDYHEQHAYAYELFNMNRKDELEIGPLCKGQTIEARQSYIDGISAVLLNSKKYLKEDYNIFLVANDKYNLYPQIATKASMQIIDRYERPVLNRTEKAKNTYSETIFHLKELES